MKRLPMVLVLALLAACGSREERSVLRRQAVGPAPGSGWARLVLDGPAQRDAASLWLSDDQGRAVPFLWTDAGIWAPRSLGLARVLKGRDRQGRPSVEFSLQVPERRQPDEREQLQIRLGVHGEVPWACRVDIQRRLPDGRFLALELPTPRVIYDFGPSGASTQFTIPWDAKHYRLALDPVQGAAPGIREVTVKAAIDPDPDRELQTVRPQRLPLHAAGGRKWGLRLPLADRIVGLRVELEPPAAPVLPRLSLPGGEGPEQDLAVQGMLWNLPALNAAANRVTISPMVTDGLDLELPEGVDLRDAAFLVGRAALLFPAEAGRSYFLHSGGAVKSSPGTLASLPEASREILSRAPLALGQPEPDPQGLPRVRTAGERARPWMPWAAGAAVLILGLAAFRIMKS
jgi:hypothetical protein